MTDVVASSQPVLRLVDAGADMGERLLGPGDRQELVDMLTVRGGKRQVFRYHPGAGAIGQVRDVVEVSRTRGTPSTYP